MRARSILTLMTATLMSVVATGTTFSADAVAPGSYDATIPQIEDQDLIAPEDRVYFGWSGDYLPPVILVGPTRSHAPRRTCYRSYYDGRRIKLLEDIRESGFSIRSPSPVGRRYCNGTATLTDDTRYRVYYALVQYDGFLGLSWSAEVCLDGLDKFRVYDATAGQCARSRKSFPANPLPYWHFYIACCYMMSPRRACLWDL